MMIVNDSCINLIKEFEGLSLKPYHGAADASNVFTIGYGTTTYPDGRYVALTDPPITEIQALEYLKWHVEYKAKIIASFLPATLNPNQFGALVSFAYNVGEGALKWSTLCRKVRASADDPTIREEFLKWNKSNGRVQTGLVRRRQAEADLYFKVG